MVAWFWLCILLGLPICMIDGKSDERNFRIVFDRFVAKCMAKDLFEDQSCKLTQFRNRSYLDCNVIFQRNVDRLEVDTQLDMLRPDNRTIRLYKIHFDACELWSLVDKNPLVNILARSFTKVLDKNKNRCPLIAHFNYSFTNWHLKETDLPNNLPDYQFKALTKIYADKQLAMITTLVGKVVRKK